MTAIEVDRFLPYPPGAVWRVLTDPASLGRWLMPNDFQPVVGHRFTFTTDPQPGFDGIIRCEVHPEQERVRRLLGGGWSTHLQRRLLAELAAAVR